MIGPDHDSYHFNNDARCHMTYHKYWHNTNNYFPGNSIEYNGHFLQVFVIILATFVCWNEKSIGQKVWNICRHQWHTVSKLSVPVDGIEHWHLTLVGILWTRLIMKLLGFALLVAAVIVTTPCDAWQAWAFTCKILTISPFEWWWILIQWTILVVDVDNIYWYLLQPKYFSLYNFHLWGAFY